LIQYPVGAGGTVTRVLEAGIGDQAMLLIHGVGARADRWSHNLEGLAAAGYHPFAYDLPGHGLAHKGADYDYSVPSFARMARDLLDELEIERTYLVGTSLGGHIAATLACEIPDRIAGLVLVGTVGITPIGAERRGQTQMLVTETSPDAIANKFRVILHDDSMATDALRREEHRMNTSPGASEGLEGIATYFGERLDDDVIGERLAALDAAFPILIVWGREDIGFPLEPGYAAHELLKGSRLAVMDNTAHSPYYERAETFNRIVTEFFAGQLGREPIDGVEVA